MRIAEIQIGERHRKDMGDIEGLARSIEEIGLLHPVVVRPDGMLVAGERRIKACLLLGWQDIPVTVIDLDAIVRGECDENQKRKDWTPTEAVAIAKELEPLEREAARERLAVRSVDFTEVNEADKGNALDKVADAVGMSRPTLTKAQEVIEAAEENPELFEDLPQLMDDTSIERAYKEKRRRQNRADVAKTIFPAGTYRVLYADPPWEYGQVIDKYGPAERHYATMTLEELCAMGPEVQAATAENAVLFLWSTSPKLRDAFTIADAWGFRYSGAMFVWDKVLHNYGHYNSVRHELLLICIKGSCTPDVSELVDSVQSIERSGEHSEKPEEFRRIIDALYPHGPRLEMFARKQSPGWVAWGAEA